MSLIKVVNVKNIVTIKNLNTKKRGTKTNINKITLRDTKIENLDKYKQIVVDKLYPLTD